MLPLFLFWFFGKSDYFLLTDKNFTKVIGNTNRNPIFVLFWATWCDHCRHFSPIWKSFKTKNYSFDLAEIECESNRESCANYSKHGFPNLVWFDSTVGSDGNFAFAQFTGGQSIEALQEFCNKQLHFPLKQITVNEKLNITKGQDQRTTKFFYTIKKENNKALEVAKQIATNFRDEMCEFYLIFDENEEKVEAYNRLNHLSLYNGPLTNEIMMKKFIYIHLFHFLQSLNPHIAQVYKEANLPFLAFIGSEYLLSENRNELISEVLNQLSEFIPLFYVNCSFNSFFCRYTLTFPINDTKMSNMLILWDKEKNLFWPKATINSLNETKEWLNDALSEHIKGKGPGRGILSKIIGIFWDSYGEGIGNFIMTASIPFLVPITIYLMIISNKRSEKVKEKTL